MTKHLFVSFLLLLVTFIFMPTTLQAATVKGRVWHDYNNNGVQNTAEPGLYNVKVELKKNDGTVVQTLFTNTSGNYQFNNVPTGQHFVLISSAGAGFQAAPLDVAGVAEAMDSDFNSSGESATVNLGSNTILTADAGFYNATQTEVNIICPANIITTSTNALGSVVVNYSNPTTNSSCTTGAINLERTSGLSSGQSFVTGTNNICYKATDSCGNTKTCCFTVQVNSTLSITCPANITANSNENATTMPVTYPSPTINTNCTQFPTTLTKISGPASAGNFPIGVTQVCFRANDACGSSKTCCFTVKVNSNLNINCPTNITATAAQTATNAVVSYPTPAYSSNCTGSGTLTRISGQASGTTFPIGTSQVCYSATDNCGTSKTCCFNVVVNQGAPAGPSCATFTVTPTNTTLTFGGIPAPTFSLQVWTETWTNVFNCLGGDCPSTPINIPNLSPGTKYNYKYVLYNASYNQICEVATNITLPISNPPATVLTLNCPANITATAGYTTNTATVNYTAPTPTSTCTTGSITTTRTSGPASGSAFPIGNSQVCFKATDGCNNTKTCCFNVNVVAPPPATLTLNCPSNITVTADYGAMNAPVTYTAPSSTSTCTLGSITTNRTTGLSSGAVFPLGSTQICYQANDGCANTKTCCFTVTVNTPPTSTLSLTCPSNFNVTAAAGASTATATYTAPTPTTTCNTGSINTTRISGLASGAAFPIGNTQVCYQAADGCNNINACCFIVTVNSAPITTLTLNCPSNITVTAAAGATTATANYTAPTPTTTCTIGSITTTRTSGLASGAAFPIGNTQVCFQAADSCNNINPCCFIVTVNSAPITTLTLNCPSNITVTAAAGATTATANYTAPTPTTTCTIGSITTTRTSGLASGAAFPIGNTQVCYQANDSCNNSKTCCFSVTVNTAPITTLTLNCPSNITVTAAAGATTATANYTAPTPTTTCTIGSITTTRTSGLASGAAFPIGNTQVCYQAKDGCNNSKTCCFTVTVNAAATGTNCNNITITTSGSNITIGGLTAPIIGVQVFNAAFTKVYSCFGNTCSAPTQIVPNLAPGTYFVKVDFFTASYTSICKKDQYITVTNTPTGTLSITCPQNIITYSAVGATTKVVSYANASTSGTCTSGTPTVTKTSGPNSNTAFPLGTTQVCFAAADNCNNNKTCCFNVTVLQYDSICNPNRTITNTTDANCQPTVNYAMKLNANWPGNTNDLSQFYSISSGVWDEKTDGTAIFTGTLTNNANANIKFDAVINFCGRTVTAPNGSPFSVYCKTVNATTWYYYPVWSGKLTGTSSASGVTLDIQRVGPAFQVGYGGNIDENDRLGASGGFDITITATPSALNLSNLSEGYLSMRLSGKSTPPTCTGTSNCNENAVIAQKALTLSAKRVQYDVQLDWVASPQGRTVTHFILERSTDATHFTQVANYAFTGNSNDISYLQERDNHAPRGDNYYQLTMVFADGTSHTSNVEHVRIPNPKPFSVFPNPATEKIFVELSAFEGKDVQLQIIDQLGKVVQQNALTQVGNAPQSINIAMLENGFYILEMHSEGVKRSAKLVIAKP